MSHIKIILQCVAYYFSIRQYVSNHNQPPPMGRHLVLREHRSHYQHRGGGGHNLPTAHETTSSNRFLSENGLETDII